MTNLVILNDKPSIVWVNSELIEEKIGGQYYSTKYIKYENTLRNNQVICIRDIINEYNGGPMGFQLHSYDYVTEGIPVLRTKDMSELTLEFSEPIFITLEKHKELKSSITYPGDIIISKTGQIGVVAIVPSNIKEANLNQALCNIRIKEEIIDSYFLAVFLTSKYGQYQFIRQGEGKAVQNGLTKEEILALEVPVISLEIQKHIGDKVRKAEELREKAKKLQKDAENILNTELNLRSLSIEISKNKNNFDWANHDILTDRIDSDYYKEEFIETIKHLKRSQNGYMTLNNIVQELYTGKKPVEINYGTEVYFVQSGSVSSNFLELNDKVRIDMKKYKLVQDGDILMAKDGETIGKLAINYTGKNIILNEHTYCLRFKNEYKNYGAYIYYLLMNKNINSLIRRESTGSAQRGLNLQFLENIVVPNINEKAINQLDELERNRCNCIIESKKLISDAKQDMENLIEGNFDMKKVKETN